MKKDVNTGLPLHHKNEHHEFQWEQATILEIEWDVNRRRLLEAIHVLIDYFQFFLTISCK